MIGSLFSGIGGLELGLEWAGLGPVAWQVESDARCRRVLAKHWPAADRSVEDVRDAGSASLWPVDIVSGGFPCQDVSAAGRGAGLDGARSGLWWEFRRVVDELGPLVVVVENVASGARRWLCAAGRVGPKRPSLAGAVKAWPTPTVSDSTGGPSYSQPARRNGSPGLKEITRGGPLNPAWVEALMGFPSGWTELPDDGPPVAAKPSTRGSRRARSRASGTGQRG